MHSSSSWRDTRSRQRAQAQHGGLQRQANELIINLLVHPPHHPNRQAYWRPRRQCASCQSSRWASCRQDHHHGSVNPIRWLLVDDLGLLGLGIVCSARSSSAALIAASFSSIKVVKALMSAFRLDSNVACHLCTKAVCCFWDSKHP